MPLRTNIISEPSSAINNITLDTSGNMTSGGTVVMTSPYTMRNKIINGAMVIDQRNAGAAVTTTGSFPVDRWKIQNTSDGAFSSSQSTTAPAGFTNSLYITTTTADANLTTTQQLVVAQNIEGFNTSDFSFGSASAKTVTLSFWVRSSLTGTFGGSLKNSAGDRSYPFTYSISAANTWEQKSVTVAGDTTGTWLTDNGTGLTVSFGLGVGPDRSGTAGSWAAANYNSVTSAVSVIGTLNATWYITGVQLERGTVATPFEYRNYQQELAMCQRYYFTSYIPITSSPSVGTVGGFAYTNNGISVRLSSPVPMRTSAGCSIYFNGTINQVRRTDNGATTSATATGFGQWGQMGFPYFTTSTTAFTSGVAYDFDYILNAEL